MRTQPEPALKALTNTSGAVDSRHVFNRFRARWFGLGYDEDQMRLKASELASDLNHLLSADGHPCQRPRHA